MMEPKLNDSPTDWEGRAYPDLEYYVRGRRINCAYAEYEVYELHVGCEVVEPPPGVAGHFENAVGSCTADLAAAEVFFKTEIKFDGCANTWMPYVHTCYREQLVRLGPLFDRLFDWTIELLGQDEFLR